MKNIHNNLLIELHVPDLNRAKVFYEKLGFEIVMNDEPNDIELGYITMVRKDMLGNTMIGFYGGDNRVYDQSYFKQFPRDTKRGYAIEVTVPVSDIDVFYNKVFPELKEYVVREIREKKDHDHVWKDFRMTDPFGFYIRFTELLDWGQGK